MRQLPDVIKLHEKYGGRDDFAIVTVSIDNVNSIDQMLNVIDEYGIEFPVIHKFVDDKFTTFDWKIQYVPTGLLIDPQQNIWGEFRVNEDFPEILDFLLAQDAGFLPPVMSFDSTLLDGGAVDLALNAYNPSHLPVGITLNVSRHTEVTNEDGTTGMGWSPVEDGNFSPEITLLFDEWGMAVLDLEVPADEGSDAVRYSVSAMVPGTSGILEGSGISVSSRGSVDTKEEAE